MLLPQGGRRIGAQHLAEGAARAFERGEGLGGTPGRDERVHEGENEILTQRIRGGELVELGDDVRGTAGADGKACPGAQRPQPQVVQGGADAIRLDGGVVGEGVAPPQRQCLLHRPGRLGVPPDVEQAGRVRDEPCEAGAVDVVGGDGQPVPGR
jgi:hypothetical protein